MRRNAPQHSAERHTAKVWVDRHSSRSVYICNAAAEGLRRCGYIVEVSPVEVYQGRAVSDVAVFYGLRGRLLDIASAYSAEGKTAILLDLGYWERKLPGRELDGYHRAAVNSLHPIISLEKQYKRDRWAKLNIPTMPIRVRENGYFLVAGMSEKAAGVYGLGFEQWEKDVIARLRAQSHRKIMYRPKPTTVNVASKLGDLFSDVSDNYQAVLDGAYAVVCHHSNVALDGLIRGVPFFTEGGVAKVLSGDWSAVEQLRVPTEVERMTVLHAAAYSQWTPAELRTGAAWIYLKGAGEMP